MQRIFSYCYNNPNYAAGILIFFTALLRLFFIGNGYLDLVQDEAQYWDWSRTLQMSYYSKGPLIAWIIAFWTNIFGDTVFGIRFGAIFLSTCSQLLLYLFVARVLLRPFTAVLVIFIINTIPLFLASSVLMTTDSPLLFCWILGLISLYIASTEKSPAWSFGLFGLSLIFGILAKYTMLILPSIALLQAFFLHRQGILPKGFVKKILLASVIGIIFGFLPIFIWNMQNDWVTFKHIARLAGVSSKVGVEVKPFFRLSIFLEYFVSQVGLLLPWWLYYMLKGSVFNLKQVWFAVKTEQEDLRLSILLVVAFLPIFLFFLFWSFHIKIYSNWAGMSYVAGLLLLALEVQKQFVVKPSKKIVSSRNSFMPTYIVLSMLGFLLMLSLPFLPLPTGYDPALRLKGWSDLSLELKKLQSEFPNPDKVFLLSDSYDMTAALSFYGPKQDRAYCVDLGRRKSQYDLWSAPLDKVGWDAIFVAKNPQNPQMFMYIFSEIKEIKFKSKHNNLDGQEFQILLLKNFSGFWPEFAKDY